MMILTNQQIKEISEELDSGFKAFWHKETGELVFIPDTLRHYDMDLEGWEEDIEKVESDYYAYFEFTPISSRDSFEIMEDFVDTLSDSNALKNRLIYALEHSKPFRRFMNVIDDSGNYRQKWFEFKNQALFDWVKDQVDKENHYEGIMKKQEEDKD